MILVLKNLGRYFDKLSKKIVFFVFPNLDPVIPIDQIIRSIPEVILREQVSRHVKTMKVIRNSCVEKYNFTTDLSPAFRSEMHFATRYVYRMSDVIVNIKNGACFTQTNGYLESYGSLRKWILSKPIRRKFHSKFTVSFPVTCIDTTGYAHFLLEELPRLLWALKEYPNLRLICPTVLPGYISAIYTELQKSNTLQYDPIKVSHENVLLKDFVFTQAEAYSGFWSNADVKCLRDTFLIPLNNLNKNKIYVSRRHSSRSFAHESDLEEALSNRGFQIVFLEKLRFTDQIEVFRNAGILIAPHGAGLANLVWCSPNTKIIELFTNEVFNDCFARLSSQVSCLHYCLGWENTTDISNNIVNKVIEHLARME